MVVKERTPDKLLVNVDFLKAAILENQNQKETKEEFENSKNMFLALAGGLLSCLLTLIPSWTGWNIWLKITISAFSIVFFGADFWYFVKMIQSGNKLKTMEQQNLEECIINGAKDEILYTALLIICYQKSKSGEVKFMTEKNGNFLIHCNMDSSKTAIEQKEHIINYLATSYDVKKNYVIDVLPLSENPFFSIKPIHGEIKQNGFILFQVKLKKRVKERLLNRHDASWKSIGEMEGLPDLMGRNQDIVMALRENETGIVDSFGDAYGPMHIVWNITKECPYHCAICATRDESRQELSTEDKLRVLNNIFSAKENIDILDFAGGDPMYRSEVRTVIMQAINSLGEDHISITTTGRGIQEADNIPEEEISRLLRKCEITIDASHENLAQDLDKSVFPRNSPEYCSHNYEQIQVASENLQHLIINIPLLDDDLSDDEINNLIEKLCRLKQNYSEIRIEAEIIRLMPVGGFSECYTDIDKYKNYHPLDMAKKISDAIAKMGISCRYHCSLRVLPGLNICDKRCNMLEKKIGIDCAGNVFACTWGAYLQLPEKYNIKQNPFYLGNLVSNRLKDILNGQVNRTNAYRRLSRDISNQTYKPYCETISWFFEQKVDRNGDPLSE